MNKTLLYVRTWMTATGRNRAWAKALALFALLSSVPFGVYSNDAGLQGASALSAEQAKQPISGVVVDKAGEPLIGVNVVEGPTNGATTDIDGRFTLTASPSSVLTVSYLGYKTQEVPVGNKTSFNIVLEEDSETLEEVVVVGYGTQKKASVVGSISAVNTKELKQSSSANLSTALAGRLAGLTSLQTGGGQPGKDQSSLMLRGAATTNGKSPLIMIDGVPRDNMNYLSTNEIASVSVLKDASATAVFGVRGANGVILITTKRGTVGKTEVDLSFEQSWQSFTREPDALGSLDYARIRNEVYTNDGINNGVAYTPEQMAKYENPLLGLDPNDPDYAQKAMYRQYLYPSHDYYREMISRYTPMTRVNMNLSGGTEKVKYFVNAEYRHQGGNLKVEPKSQLGYDPSAKMDRYSFRSNLDYQVTKSFKTSLDLGTYIEQVNMPSAGTYPNSDEAWMMRDMLYQAVVIPPTMPGPYVLPGFGLEDKALVHPGDLDRSPFEVMNRQGYRNTLRTNLNATLNAEWKLDFITKGLMLKGLVAYDSYGSTTLQSYKLERVYRVTNDNDTPVFSEKQKAQNLSLAKGKQNNYTINMQASLNYNRTFGKHTVTGLFLAQRDYWEAAGADLPYNILGISGRVAYDFDQRYFAEFNMGYNGSEQFAPSKRFGFFPSFAVGWQLSNENFLKDSKVITNLKLRASYGEVGNDQLGGARFLYLDNITLGDGTLTSLGNGKNINAGLLGNPYLSWETAKKQNYGIDLQLFGDLSVTFDYFIENREGILINRDMVPMIQGTPLGSVPKANMGKVRNKGFELEVNYNKAITKDLSLQFRGNFAFVRNKQLYMDEALLAEDYVYRYRKTGVPLNTNWGYKIDYSNGTGMFNSKEELDNYLATTSYDFGTPGVGDFKYIDMNGDGVVNDKDHVPLRYTDIPEITYGLTLGLNYKWFDFTIFFQGNSHYASGIGAEQNIYEYIKHGTYFPYHRSAWTAERYANGEKITYPALHNQASTNHVANDFFIHDRSFIRLKNIELGYTLPQGVLKAIGISRLRVYVSGQNLFTWSPMVMTHIDPEQNDPIGYPITKMMNVGVNITF